MNRAEYSLAYPDSFFLDPSDVAGLGTYLADRGRLGPGERVLTAERAGEGNMNCVVRVRVSGENSFILKQARPWVEKYPVIAAPRDRALVEANFYGLTADIPAVAARMPSLLWVDADARLLALEDLGAARDFFSLYTGGAALDPETLDALADYLAALHAASLPPAAVPGEADDDPLTNRAMRALNHAHIFDLPLRPDNGLDLDAYTPGLAAAAAPLRADPAYAAAVRALGERYLANPDGGPGGTLVHGDFFPGSWLRTPDGTLRVIDPEFSFRGDAAFDVGTTLAHLLLSEQPVASADRFLARYRPAGSTGETAWRLAGVEIMRRLIGVAQLPLPPDLPRKRRLLALSHRLVLDPARARESLERSAVE